MGINWKTRRYIVLHLRNRCLFVVWDNISLLYAVVATHSLSLSLSNAMKLNGVEFDSFGFVTIKIWQNYRFFKLWWNIFLFPMFGLCFSALTRQEYLYNSIYVNKSVLCIKLQTLTNPTFLREMGLRILFNNTWFTFCSNFLLFLIGFPFPFWKLFVLTIYLFFIIFSCFDKHDLQSNPKKRDFLFFCITQIVGLIKCWLMVN